MGGRREKRGLRGLGMGGYRADKGQRRGGRARVQEVDAAEESCVVLGRAVAQGALARLRC
jgi:hypothetical protein